jgi:hypothetical protein
MLFLVVLADSTSRVGFNASGSGAMTDDVIQSLHHQWHTTESLTTELPFALQSVTQAGCAISFRLFTSLSSCSCKR